MDRLFYYDCIEDHPRSSETPEDFDVRVQAQADLISRATKAQLCHVRLGTLKERQRGKRITQKEVDVKIAVDMLTDAANRTTARADLVTGDLDFRPVVERLVQLGVIVGLRYDPLVTADELIASADLTFPLRAVDWWNFASPKFKRANPLPGGWGGEPRGGEKLLRQGAAVTRKPVRLYSDRSGGFVIEVVGSEDDDRAFYQHPNKDYLLRYVSFNEGEITWF